MMTARQATQTVQQRLNQRGIPATFEDAAILRRAELTLQRWGEQECGDGNDHMIWSIERDEETDRPYKCVYPHSGPMKRYPIADREKGALKRVQAVCKRLNAHFFHQTDPRGCTLYVSAEPITDNDYSNGVACCE